MSSGSMIDRFWASMCDAVASLLACRSIVCSNRLRTYLAFPNFSSLWLTAFVNTARSAFSASGDIS